MTLPRQPADLPPGLSVLCWGGLWPLPGRIVGVRPGTGGQSYYEVDCGKEGTFLFHPSVTFDRNGLPDDAGRFAPFAGTG